MKIKILALLTIVAMSVFIPTNAGFFRGSQLLSFCESEATMEGRHCWMYLAGVSDSHGNLSAWGFLTQNIFCIPDDAHLSQLQKVFIKYANENPQDLHQDATSLVINAFAVAFPCEQS